MSAAHSNLRHAVVAPPPCDAPWCRLIPEGQWTVFHAGASGLARAGEEFLLHGAFALAHYTGRWRDTKDVDVIIRPALRARVVEALRGEGFEDYYAREAYDRSWIFRGYREGVIFDVIWDLPNHRVPIDDGWFQRASSLTLRGRSYQVVPLEELVRVKLYVFQRERCDWIDVLNVMAAGVEQIDWDWLVKRMGRDEPLLQGALAVFNWLCPGRSRLLPVWLRTRYALPSSEGPNLAATEERRVRVLDSRPWFGPYQPEDQPMER